MSVEEVCKQIEADSLGYLSMEGMLEATGMATDSVCTACWSEKYPTEIGNRSKDIG
jgi:amidophosphoribosyltransferase